jgi:general secretion pathway protein J
MRARGFTLLEVLVAVVVFGIISVLAYGGYNQLIQQSDIVERSASRTRVIQSTVQRMTEDFAMLEPRPIREPIGESLEPALRAGGTRVETLADLTRSGWAVALHVAASHLSPDGQQAGARLLDRARSHLEH